MSYIKTLLELTGYTFHRDNLLEIITYLHGYGGNGKGHRKTIWTL
jgi:hypothetical protein